MLRHHVELVNFILASTIFGQYSGLGGHLAMLEAHLVQLLYGRLQSLSFLWLV